MLTEIGAKVRVPDYIKRVKAGEIRLMGFGHRVYKHYDPRAEITKRVAEEVFTVTGTNPLLEIALELERIALQDDYFVSRHLYPNVDFYSGSSTRPWGFPWRCSRCSSPSHGRRDGWRSGRNSSRTPSKRSFGRGSSTMVP